MAERRSQGALTRRGLSFPDQTEDVLRRQILSGERAPGERLNEVQIAAELAVSRGPVREAMQRLSRDGLIRFEPHKGAFVRRLGPAEVVSLFEVRISLETTAAGLAAERRTTKDLTQLDRMLSRAKSEMADSEHAHYPRHLDLHGLIAKLSGNEKLRQLIDQVNQELQLMRAASGFQPERALGAIDEHAAIVIAIAAGDVTAASEGMNSHLRRALSSTLQLLEQEEQPAGHVISGSPPKIPGSRQAGEPLKQR